MKAEQRNPGPTWGYRFLQSASAWLPRPLFRWALRAGAVVGWALMPRARFYSQAYWQTVTGKPQTVLQQWRHFADFAETLVAKLELSRGLQPRFHLADEQAGQAFMELCRSDRAALFGSFHIGEADLMGAYLSDFNREIHMIRLRVGNSRDTDALGEAFGGSLKFIWINQPEEMLFALKRALEAGHSVALHCDRLGFGARREAFEFLGAQRWFPFTIYHLSALFQVPIVFAFAARRDERGSIPVVTSAVFEPSDSKADSLARDKLHFQAVLKQVETLLRADPYLWFNFEPLNEEVAS